MENRLKQRLVMLSAENERLSIAYLSIKQQNNELIQLVQQLKERIVCRNVDELDLEKENNRLLSIKIENMGRQKQKLECDLQVQKQKEQSMNMSIVNESQKTLAYQKEILELKDRLSQVQQQGSQKTIQQDQQLQEMKEKLDQVEKQNQIYKQQQQQQISQVLVSEISRDKDRDENKKCNGQVGNQGGIFGPISSMFSRWNSGQSQQKGKIEYEKEEVVVEEVQDRDRNQGYKQAARQTNRCQTDVSNQWIDKRMVDNSRRAINDHQNNIGNDRDEDNRQKERFMLLNVEIKRLWNIINELQQGQLEQTRQYEHKVKRYEDKVRQLEKYNCRLLEDGQNSRSYGGLVQQRQGVGYQSGYDRQQIYRQTEYYGVHKY